MAYGQTRSGADADDVERGKGLDRMVMPSPALLEWEPACWRKARPEGWPCAGKPKANPIPPKPLNHAFASARHRAGVKTPATLHRLLQQLGPLLEAHTEMRVIEVLPGQAKPRHIYVASKPIQGTVCVTAMLARV